MAKDKQAWLMTGTHVWSRIPLLVLFTLLAIWARLTEEFQKQERLQQQAAQKQTEAELKWLKAQLSPHFLFNALNNIHSLVQLQDKKASPMLVKLSDMMRYVLKESESQLVPLQQEVTYLRNYIALQTLKQSWQHKISFEVLGNITGVQVAPLLFINFVENACKHSNLDEESAFVTIQIIYTGSHIQFISNNSFKLSSRKDATSGIGITNVKNRLQLLYPGRHHLAIQESGNEYQVELEIECG